MISRIQLFISGQPLMDTKKQTIQKSSIAQMVNHRLLKHSLDPSGFEIFLKY